MALYVWRLICVSAAVFFAVHTLMSLLLAVLAPLAIRSTANLRPRTGARYLLALRLAPAVLGILTVLVFCVPSYLWFEPAGTNEHARWGSIAAALLALVLWSISIMRATRALLRSRSIMARWRSVATETQMQGMAAPVLRLASDSPVLALAGIAPAQIVMSSAIERTLTAEQLAVALRHESAHRDSHDNFKRLLLLLAPAALPGMDLLAPLERHWRKLVEWAADDSAAADEPQCSFALAEALVSMARAAVTSPVCAAPLATPLLADPADLRERVERLLHPR